MAITETSEVIRHLRRVVLQGDGAGLSDAQLLDDYLSRRDGASVAALVRRHGPMVWGVCRRVLGNHHDAEDAFQATFLILMRKAASIASRGLVANWLYGVAHRTALKAAATLGKRRTRERQVTDMPEPTVAERRLQSDLESALDDELSQLPEKYRTVLVLCELEDKSRKEAARQLGLPEGTVGSRLRRAKSMLARRLARRSPAVPATALATVLPQSAASAKVPAAVVSSTIEAATLVAAGKAATSAVISAKVAALIEGVLKSMLLSKLKIGAAILLGLIAIAAGAYAIGSTALQKEPPPAKEPPATKTERAAEPKPAPIADENTSPFAGQGRLEGRFTAADTGLPVAGAKLRLIIEGAGNGSFIEAPSGADGRYVVEVPFGHCWMFGVFAPPGYFTQERKTYETFVTTSADPRVVRDFVLQPGSAWRLELDGVTAPPGKPALCSASPEQLSSSGENIMTFADAHGKGTLTIPTSGGRWTFTCRLMTSPSPYEISSAKLEIDKNFDPRQIKGAPESVAERKAVRLRDSVGRTAIVEGVEVAVESGQAILRFHAKSIAAGAGLAVRATAKDEAGKPLAGAKFTAAFSFQPPDKRVGVGRGASMSNLQGTTNEQGNLEISDVRLPADFFANDGAISMVVVKADFDGVQTPELNLLALKQAGIADFGTVTLKPGRTLRGIVVDDNGSRVHGAIVTNHTNYFLYSHLRCRTDAEGRFVMPDLSYGKQRISASYGERSGQTDFQFDEQHSDCLITVKLIPKSGMRQAPVAAQPRERPVPPPKFDLGWDLTPPLKEPKYQHEPKYALLVFGPERKQRVWMVLDGQTLYVDRNGNGDLTEPEKRLEPNNPTDSSNKFGGSGSHTHFDVFEFTVQAGVAGTSKFVLQHWIRAEKFVPQTEFDKQIVAHWQKLHHENSTLWRKEGSGQGQTPLIFMPKPADAQVCALDGPLTFVVKLPQYQVLKRGEAGVDVAFHIVVKGRPHKGAEQEFYNPLATKEVPEAAHLEVDIDFPVKAAGAPPIHRKYLLKNRC